MAAAALIHPGDPRTLTTAGHLHRQQVLVPSQVPVVLLAVVVLLVLPVVLPVPSLRQPMWEELRPAGRIRSPAQSSVR